MTVETWPIARIKPYERNARKIPQSAVDKVALSLRTFGWRQPIVVDKAGVIVVGHVRRLGALQNGYTDAPVHVADGLTPEQVKAYRLMDNRSNEETTWDVGLLGPELTDLKGFNLDLSLTGFSPAELSRLLPQDCVEPEPQLERADELQAKWKVERGQVWEIGAHRLMCGDATSKAQMRQLIGKTRLDMVYTDPPYGVHIIRKGSIGGDKPFGKNGFDSVIKAGVYPEMVGDDSPKTALAGYEVCKSLKAPIILLWGGNHFAHLLPPTRCWVVWDKETDGNFADGEIAWCSAPKSVRIFRHKWSGMLKASEHGERRAHPTQKPCALARWAFEEFIPSGRVVLDSFAGSGSTAVAAEQTGRVSFNAEISPAYCAVTLERMADMGLTPRLAA